MRIKKTSETAPIQAQIINTYSTSETDGYSANYINENVGVVDSGSNTNGNYIKYSDGRMICYREVNTTISCTTTWFTANLYYGISSTTYNFSQQFISTPTVLHNIITTSDSGIINIQYNPLIITTTGVSGFSIGRPSSNASVPVKIVILAIGKWK